MTWGYVENTAEEEQVQEAGNLYLFTRESDNTHAVDGGGKRGESAPVE